VNDPDDERLELAAQWHVQRAQRARPSRIEPSVITDNRTPERPARYWRDQLRAMLERQLAKVGR